MRMEKHGRLVDSLIERTRSGAIEWKPAPEQDEFQISFKDNTVRIRQKIFREGGVMYYVDLVNAEGTTVETFNDGELDEDAGLAINTKWFKRMGELYEIVRRNALGSDKILDSILNELDEIVPF